MQWCILIVIHVDYKSRNNNKTKKAKKSLFHPQRCRGFCFLYTCTCAYTCMCTCICTCTCTHVKTATKTSFFGWRVGQSYTMNETAMAPRIPYSSAEARLDASTDHRSVSYPIYTHVDDSLMHGCIYQHCDDCRKANNQRIAFQCTENGAICLG